MLSPNTTQGTHLPIQAGPTKPRSAAISSTTAVRSIAESDIDDLEVGDITPSPSLKSVEHFVPWLAGVEPHASPTQSPDLAGLEDAQSIPESLDMLRIDSNPQSTPIIPVVWGPHNKPHVEDVSIAHGRRNLGAKDPNSSNEGSSSGAETIKPHLKRANIICASDFEKHEHSRTPHSGPAPHELGESKSECKRRMDEVRRVIRAEYVEQQRQIRHKCRAALVKREALILLLLLILLIPLALCIVLGSLPSPRWIHFSLAASRSTLVLAYLAGVLASWILMSEVALITDYAVQFATGWNLACGTTRPPLWRWSKRVTLYLFAAAFIGGPNLFPRAAKAGMWPRLCAGDNSWLAVEMSGRHAMVSLRDGANWHEQFTFNITSTNTHITTFQLLDYTASGTRVIPAISVVDYATASGEFVGRCERDNGALCPTALNITGNIHDFDSRITFEITTNGTQNALFRAYDKKWSFEDAPVLDLRAISNESVSGTVDRKHAPVILRTSLHRCPRMKTCIPRPRVVQTENGVEVLGPEVLVPLGWVAMRAQEWGAKCTGRSLGPYTIS